MKLTNKVVQRLLPQQVRMTYGLRDVLVSALEIGAESKIDCVDDPADKPEYIAVYKLVRVEKTNK